jgi:hypothetical protein
MSSIARRSCFFLLYRLHRKKSSRIMMIPPMAPPTAGPMGLDFFFSLVVGGISTLVSAEGVGAGSVVDAPVV